MLNKTSVVGVSLTVERTRAGRLMGAMSRLGLCVMEAVEKPHFQFDDKAKTKLLMVKARRAALKQLHLARRAAK